ncbi:SpaA isopeptide-forming pilin-related protein [Lactiplantibacillus brownii]|uniref:SpaA isopeptide-forming pilin-related protein n=1 Tax=Lactiplantibacillus brownii TaxID=3069269 RepID=UPI0038B3D602
MILNKKQTQHRIQTFIAGAATLLTLLVTSTITAKADDTATTSATSTSEATMTSSHSTTPDKTVVLPASKTATSSYSEPQTSSASTTTSTSQATSHSATVTTSMTATKAPSTSSDTTESVDVAKGSSVDASGQSDANQVQAKAKATSAQNHNQQSNSQQYSAVTTSQKDSSAQPLQSQASLARLSYTTLATLAAQAKQAVNGLTAADATVTDSDGKIYSASDALSLYATYLAKYHWSIDNGVTIKAGETATLTLPNNVLFTTGTTDINMMNSEGQSIGTFSAAAGSQTGTLTFNDYFAVHEVSERQGSLSFNVTGTDTTIGDSSAKINKVGWPVQNGTQTDMEWQAVVNLGSEAWNDVTLVDQLGQYQTHNSAITFEKGQYVDGSFSATAKLGSYDFETDHFTPATDVSATAVIVTVDGNQMTIKLGNITTAINLYYSVALEAGQTYTNSISATYTPATTTDPGDGGTTDPGSGDGDGGNTPDKSQTVNSRPSYSYGGSGSAEWQTYSLVINKTDQQTGAAVVGATYRLQTTTGTVLQSGLVTNQAGQIVMTNLAAGTYVLVETAAPTGYLVDQTAYSILVGAETAVSGVVSKAVTDTAIAKTTVVVKKVWQNVPKQVTTPAVTVRLILNGTPTAQTLTLTAANGYQGSFDNLAATDANGQLLQYTVVETPLTGYTSTQTTTDQTATLTNTYQTGTLTLIKTDTTGQKRLAGATFTLTNAAGNVVATVVTDKTGQAVVTGLTQGTYTLRETLAPTGYVVDTTPQTVTLTNETNYQTTVTVADALEPTGSVTVIKIDGATQAKLSQAKFELRNAQGQVVRTGVTGANGQLRFSDLAVGTYTLHEVTAPTGYDLNSASQTVTINRDNQYQMTVTIADTATPIVQPTGSLTLTKVDHETTVPLAGATFDLMTSAGKLVATGTTDAAGRLTFTDLALGTYTLVEQKAPSGYLVATQASTVTLTTTKLLVAITVTDAKLPTGVTPVVPEQPTEPVKPVEPGKPTEPETPTEPEQPVEPTQPTEPEDSTQPASPKAPTETTAADKIQPSETGSVMVTNPARSTTSTTGELANMATTPVKAAMTAKIVTRETSKSTSTLPQTGENKSVWVTMIGWLMFVLVGWFIERRVRV